MSDGSLRSRVLRGAAWKVVSQIVNQSSRVVVAVVLARLLTPTDFGLAGMVLVFSLLVYIFSDLALGAALVQRNRLTEEDRSTAFWVSLAAGGLFTAAGIAASGLIADFYGEPKVAPLFAALSVSFVVTALGTTQTALLERDMRFRQLEMRRMAGTLAGAGVGIAAAVAGAGAWAIIGQQVAVAVVSTALIWGFSDWRPRFVFSRESLRHLLGFSANVFGSRILFYFNRNTDNLLIGRFVGPAGLGAYSLAYNVMLFPFNQIASPIQEVLFPAFARMQDEPGRMARAWITVNRLVGAVSIPALVGLAITAPDFVPVVLGARWEPAVPVLQVLTWVGLLQSLQRLNSSILLARDRTGTLLRYSIGAFAGSLVGFVVGLHWGIAGVAVGYAVASTLIEPVYAHLTARSVETTLWAFARSLAGVAQATAVMAAAMLLVRGWLMEGSAGRGTRLVVVVAVGALVYVAVALWRVPEIRTEARSVRRRRRDVGLPAEAKGSLPPIV